MQYIAAKIRELRVFEDDGDPPRHMNRSVLDVGGAVLVVSQFTLAGDCRKGRRPSFDAAAAPQVAKPLYEDVVRELESSGAARRDRRVPGDDAGVARQRRTGHAAARQQKTLLDR